MREQLAGTGLLWVGLVAAVAVWSGLADGLLAGLPGWAGRVLLGILVFSLFAALYFRSHWAATLAVLEARGPGTHQIACRLEEVATDLDRSAHVIADNLTEVGSSTEENLYLDGARAHAAKLGDVVLRLRGAADQLTRPEGVE